jgi:hypothetical protein
MGVYSEDLDALREELGHALTSAQAMNAPALVVSPLARSLAELRATGDGASAVSTARGAIRNWRTWAFGRTGPGILRKR